MKYVRIENNIVREIIDAGDSDINKMFTKELVKTMIKVPKDVKVKEGYIYENGIFSKPEKQKRLLQEIRQKRNQLLQETDWTQFPDSPLKNKQKSAWNKYRQQLRDLPQDFKNPENVKWPKKPE